MLKTDRDHALKNPTGALAGLSLTLFSISLLSLSLSLVLSLSLSQGKPRTLLFLLKLRTIVPDVQVLGSPWYGPFKIHSYINHLISIATTLNFMCNYKENI